MNEVYWGLDIGGTKTALCVGNGTQILWREALATQTYPHWQALVDDLIAMLPPTTRCPKAVGISCGGPLDSALGIILTPPTCHIGTMHPL